jgi:hypothetical protein
MPQQDGSRKSSRVSTATEKRKAAGELTRHHHTPPLQSTDDIADEGGEEQIAKKMKALEDRIATLTGSNAALTDTIRSIRKRNTDTHHDDDNDSGASNNNDEDSDDGADSPMLFKSRKVCALGLALLH